MSVPFMHNLYSEVCTIEDIAPGIDDSRFRVNDRLVKVKTIKVESHCGYTERCKPNANHGPSSKKEMQATAIVEGRILKN